MTSPTLGKLLGSPEIIKLLGGNLLFTSREVKILRGGATDKKRVEFWTVREGNLEKG